MIGNKKAQVQDRHEHGGLPDTIQDPVIGHVICHCPRCEAERESKRTQAEATAKEWGGYITDCLQEVEGSEAADAFREVMKQARSMPK